MQFNLALLQTVDFTRQIEGVRNEIAIGLKKWLKFNLIAISLRNKICNTLTFIVLCNPFLRTPVSLSKCSGNEANALKPLNNGKNKDRPRSPKSKSAVSFYQ